MPQQTENITDTQQRILALIKAQGEASNADIAAHLDITYEAVRQHLRRLEDAGLLVVRRKPADRSRAGRPTVSYALSAAGEHLFPKTYDELALELIDTLSSALGPDALRQVLATLTDENVARWGPRLEDRPVPERLEALKGIYLDGDPFMEVHRDAAGGDLRLEERNCPFLNVASRRPALCSVTTSTLSRLLGRTVTREKKFQEGDGRCVFRVHMDRPVSAESFRFAFEEEVSAGAAGSAG